MIIGLKSTDRYLYHYTKASTAINDILPKNTLKIGSLILTNDPKETKQWEFDIGSNEGRDLGNYDIPELSRWLSDTLKSRMKVICFSKDQSPLSGNHLKDIFKRGYCKPRMWAQYAEKHTGVCLVFDREKLDESITSAFGNKYAVRKREVIYQDRSIVPNLSEGGYMINVDILEQRGYDLYASLHFDVFHKRLFFEKMKDWSHEDEYRWVIATDIEGPLFFDFQKSLAGIVFGDSTNEKDIDQIIKLTDYKIKYTGIKWKNCSPWYNFENLKYDKALRNSPWFKGSKQ